MVRVPLGPLTVSVGPALRVTEAIGGGTATTVPLWIMLPFGSGKLLMVQEFTGKTPSGTIEDAGRLSPAKTADPVSVLAVLIVPAMGVPIGGTLMPVCRPSRTDP